MTSTPSSILDKLAATVTESTDLEQLVRPFLEILEELSGLESIYLSVVDEDKGTQHILFAHNTKTKQLEISEGASTAWAESLCKRALDEETPYSHDVLDCWDDLEVVKQLGINTYLGVPVHVGEGELFGTLCCASGSRIKIDDQAKRLIKMLAKLIAQQLERDRLMERLQKENVIFSQQALTDPLTGIPNRRALLHELKRAISGLSRSGDALHLAFMDLDGFKKLNDRYGHDAGDRFLIQVAKKLMEGLRDSDFVARYGGDEFIVFGPVYVHDLEESREAIHRRLENLTAGTFDLNGEPFNFPGASVGVVTVSSDEETCDEVIVRADEAMFQVKELRRSRQ